MHALPQGLSGYGWAGFWTRYWLISDHDACLAYLSRAAWDPETTPEQTYRDQVRAVCGNAAVEDMLAVFKTLEQVTIALEDHALGLTFPVPGMMTKHLQPGPLPANLAADRERYRQALSAAKRALKKCNRTGRPYVRYWIGRLTFGVGYLDCIEATRRIATAEAEAKQAEAKTDTATAGRKWKEAATRAEEAVRIARTMLEAYADVTRNQSDRGAIATLVEYVYRPLKAKAASLKKHD